MKDQAYRLRELISGSGDARAVPAQTDVGQGVPRIIAITSGKGGVGKTTLAVGLALLLARKPSRVLLVDADLGLANVDVMLGMHVPRHMGHLLLTDCGAGEIAVEGPGGIRVISGGSGLRDLANAGPDARGAILGKLAQYYGNFDYVVVDTSPGIGADVVDFLLWADDLLLVTTTEPTSLKDAYASLKMIAAEMPDKEATLVVNRADSGQADQAIKILNQITEKFLARHCNCWHTIEHDDLVARAVRERKPFVMRFPKSPAAVSIGKLADEIARIRC